MLQSLSPKSLPLSKYERKVSGPRGVIEEGIMEHLLQVVPPETKYCIEFGARDGSRAHTRYLVDRHEFSAFFIEGDPDAAERLKANFAHRPDVATLGSFVTPENIESLFAAAGVPAEPYLLVIDIDGNDYYVWQAIQRYRPWFIAIEFNASYGPGEHFLIDYRPDFVWTGDDYFGASILPMIKLARSKGYELIHCTSGGDNLYFVRKEFFARFGISDNSAEAMYQLPQYGRFGRAPNGKGHPASAKTTTRVKRVLYRVRYHALAPLRRVVKSRMKKRHRS